MGFFRSLLEVTDERLQALYHRAWLECNRGVVDIHSNPELRWALTVYAKEHNCTLDEAYLFAKTGKKLGRLGE